MAGFIHHFLSGLRIWLCAKQVIANIQSLSSAQGARLALMIALFRARMLEVQVPGGFVTVGDIVQHPVAYKEELCYAAFCLLRDMRQASRDTIRSYASFKVSPTPAVREHTEICDLALSLLMSTIGVGCRPSILETVKYSWEHVATYTPTPSDIAIIMKMPEYIVNDIIEQPLETAQWLEKARQSPDFLKSTI